MKNQLLIPTLLTILFSTPLAAEQPLPARDVVLAAMDEFTKASTLPPDPAAPKEDPTIKDSILKALERYASDQPDPEMVRVLLLYQFYQGTPKYPLSAEILGQLLWSQPKTFIEVYKSLEPAMQRKNFPYVSWGWKTVTAEKNKSDRKYKEINQLLDRYRAGMINMR